MDFNKGTKQKIDVFQRSLLKKILKIFYPHKIRNTDLYNRMKMTEWSKAIQKRRLKWIGHLLRLEDNAPASIALNEIKKKTGKKKKENYLTWKKQRNNDLRLVYENLNL